MTRRTDGVSFHEVDNKLLSRDALWDLGLSGDHRERGADQVNLLPGTVGQVGATHIPAIGILLRRETQVFLEPRLNFRECGVICVTTAGCGNVGDEMWLIFIVGFRHLDFAPNPLLHPLLAVARIGVMRRLDLSASIISGADLIHDLLARFLELLHPNRFQNLYFWQDLNHYWHIGFDQSRQ